MKVVCAWFELWPDTRAGKKLIYLIHSMKLAMDRDRGSTWMWRESLNSHGPGVQNSADN